ncbi:GNAT family N-acetyltransferase [Plantactinospora sp. S1510]|uniref:GNAT family N-acetyltransferase n=1 Tax=Plantactinospora alkalitolerans TaxID=2789879 RepID=A0ABS0GPT3_9ACTN|nr:GNAT family N-acetyltransferase [Plantactinospora alkalitolerans]MBF9128210.1 GNAT family N-acetyltransferase [Plantactinospora alkalitolerans]
MRPTVTQIRQLEADEFAAAGELGRLAFGGAPAAAPAIPAVPETPTAAPATPVPPPSGLTRYGAFDVDGRLVGKAVDLHHEQWWAGRRVVAADVAGVAVLPEARGRGVARSLLQELLRGAHAREAAVSALYPTVTEPYRRSGWEVTGALRAIDLPTVALPRPRPAPDLSVRPGGPEDLPAVADLYERIARHRSGLLTRRGGLFDQDPTPGALPDGVDGLTLVEQGGHLVGYASWERGRGYDQHAVLTVRDVLATTPEAARELVGVLASWHSVTPTVRLWPLAHDAIAAQLPLDQARQHEQRVWMHRPVDVARAVTSRGWPVQVRGRVEFALTDDVAPWNSGNWRLEVDGGSAELHRITEQPPLVLSVRGFALLYTGAANAYATVEAGLLHCPAGTDPGGLDLLGTAPRAELLDYF